jgi:hypothetical protein
MTRRARPTDLVRHASPVAGWTLAALAGVLVVLAAAACSGLIALVVVGRAVGLFGLRRALALAPGYATHGDPLPFPSRPAAR